MSHAITLNRFLKMLAGMALCAALAMSHQGHAALVNLAQAPLATATTTSVLPNIMFTLDDSGSMSWDFMPDWVGDDYPRSSKPNLYRNSAWNVIYYNPAITYTPPTHFDADGNLDTATYPSKTSGWSSVKYDAYGKLSNDVTSYPDQLCPNGSTPSGSAPNQTCDLTGGRANFFTFVVGEYCTLPNLKVCITASAPSATHPFPAPVRWCNNASLAQSGGTNKCQALKSSTFMYPRFPGAQGASATLSISSGSSTSVSSVKVNGLEILSATTSASSDSTIVATRIRDNINACTASSAGNCTTAGYRATASGSVVTIIAPGSITYTPVVIKSGGKTITASAFSGGLPGNTIYTEIDPSVTSYPYPGTTTKHPNRTDCVGATCTYGEEMTNFANWFTYYHVRLSMMKSGVSRAFKSVDNKFRVGFNTISYTGATDGTNFLHIDKFELTQKKSWYDKLFAKGVAGGTPLRNSLGKVGRLFANKVTGQQDPMQYSCQQSFSILSTDGYWNSSSGTYSLSSGLVGNLDGGSTPRPMFEGPTSVSNSLADIAKYYYDTDLRTSALGNCTGALGIDVCENDVFTSDTDKQTQQHMTTFTIGLGADGTLVYQDNYLTDNYGDFYDLKNGLNSVNWPTPAEGDTSGANIDDLWHAAVNGYGEYFSAKNPDQIVKGLGKALASIAKKIGAGAAAATSTPNITNVDNKAFVASYTTGVWRGNLEGRLINTDTGATSETASWCVEDVPPEAFCTSPSYLQNDTSGASNVWYCVTPLQSTCSGGTLVGTDCKVEVAASCTGSLKNKVSASSDSRVIYMKNAAGSNLVAFKYDNMTAGQKAYFSSPTALSQWPALTAPEQALAAGANLVDYLRGQTGYEDRAANASKLYRLREATLGDAVESQPIFIGKPVFSYTDTGYDAFKTAQAGRAKTVFLGANDGMLHAFNAETGEERWAYVPSMVMANMWKLADKNYPTMHTYYVNGAAVTSEIYDGASWRTILVGSLHGGGLGFYALDVTDPASPKFLWEFTNKQTVDHALMMDKDVGYSFAEPKIGKRPSDGKWVVFLTSGYNNIDGLGVDQGDGKGYVYGLDPITGAILHKIGTGEGDTTTPSGLAKIEFYAEASERDNTVKFIYGGDLLGNLWRIDMSDYSVLKFAKLMGSGAPQPITTRPELAAIKEKRVVYVATGKYLEIADLSTTQQQTVYAIKDDDATATFTDPRASSDMEKITITPAGAYRDATGDSVDFVTQRGWFADLPEKGERANVDPRLEFGTLLFATTVPASTACEPGGHGWENFVDYKTGKAAASSTDLHIGVRTNTPPVGLNIVMLPDGRIIASGVEAGDPTPRVIPGVGFSTKSGGFQGKRVIWREMVP